MTIDQDSVALFATPITIGLIVLEIIYSSIYHKKYYDVKETLTNFYLTALNIGVNLAVRVFYIFIYTYFYEHRFFQIENVFFYWFTLVMLEDVMYYFLHVLDHTSRFFWAIHVTHHSSTDYNFTVGFRSSVFQPLYRFLFFIPIALMGYSAMHIMAIYSLTQIWGIFVHTKAIKKMPKWIGYFLVTPSHHRVHHGSNIQYLDKNMGMLLIIWDRIFGTFQAELDDEEVHYGLVTDPENRGPINIVFHEFKSIINDLKKTKNLKTRLKYIFFRPGWSHDGSKKTSVQLRKEIKN